MGTALSRYASFLSNANYCSDSKRCLEGCHRGEFAADTSLLFLSRLSYQTTRISYFPSRCCSKRALTHQLQSGGASDVEVIHSLQVNKEIFLPEANDSRLHDYQSWSIFYQLIFFFTVNIQGILFTCFELQHDQKLLTSRSTP